MFKRIAAICFIFFCATLAWMVLGATIVQRTRSSGEHLRGSVQSVWGVPQVQKAAFAEYLVPVKSSETVEERGVKRIEERTRLETRTLFPTSSDLDVGIHLDHRQKGLMWYSTYKVSFRGEYQFRNTTGARQKLRLILPFPATRALYDDLQFLVDGQPARTVALKDSAYAEATLDPDAAVQLRVSYQSQGMDSWRYSFGQGAGGDVSQVSNFHLRVNTDFKDIDFADNTLAPGDKHETPAGWQLDWTYKNLLSGYQIALEMPEKLQPGPLASQISFFAPVSLFLFFFVLFLITMLRGIDLHPMNYFFLAGAFFSFHLLLAYLADHVDIRVAFATASAVSVFLATTYLRIVGGMKAAWREAALAQFLYLVLFSCAFFFKGYTGLAVTIGAIVTLFVAMQMTGRINWSEKFAAVNPGRLAMPPSL
jgi:inner membrane protein involved in colicin E2 resistance